MIVSKVKLDLSGAPWAANMNSERVRVQGLSRAVDARETQSSEHSPFERRTLGEVLYLALVETAEAAN